MGIVLIAGLQESSKDTILEVLLEDRSVPDFEHITLEGIESHQKDMKKFLQDSCRNIERSVIESLKARKNVIINVPFTIETKQGYVPVLSGEFFGVVKPDVLILIEDVPDIRLPKEKRKGMQVQQELDKKCATQYSSDAKSPLKMIRIKPGGMKESIREIKDVIKSVFV